MFAADFVAHEVKNPIKRSCRSCTTRGALPPVSWEREGVGKGFEATRFFEINSQAKPDVNGQYCEPCLVVARAMSNEIKSNHRS